MTIFGTLDSDVMQAVSVQPCCASNNTIIAFIPPIAFQMFSESLGDELPLLAH